MPALLSRLSVRVSVTAFKAGFVLHDQLLVRTNLRDESSGCGRQWPALEVSETVAPAQIEAFRRHDDNNPARQFMLDQSERAEGKDLAIGDQQAEIYRGPKVNSRNEIAAESIDVACAPRGRRKCGGHARREACRCPGVLQQLSQADSAFAKNRMACAAEKVHPVLSDRLSLQRILVRGAADLGDSQIHLLLDDSVDDFPPAG